MAVLSQPSVKLGRREKRDLRCREQPTVNFAYNDTRRGIRKVSLFAKCPYTCTCTRSLIIIMGTGRIDFALGMEILSLFANCRYIRSRY